MNTFEHWHWPQYTFAALIALRVIIHSIKDGDKLDETYKFSTAITGACITVFILYMGGFWTAGAP